MNIDGNPGPMRSCLDIFLHHVHISSNIWIQEPFQLFPLMLGLTGKPCRFDHTLGYPPPFAIV
jgi:hypothetical protein